MREVEVGWSSGLLGDVEVRLDGRPVQLGHARQRGVLVVLLVEANRAISVDKLVDRVWGDRAPQRARQTLYNYLSRLRQALSPIGEVDLVRQSGGYVLAVDPMAVDAHRFRHLVTQARAADDEDRALVLLEQALWLWRGQPCAGLDTPWVNTQRDALEQDRFAVELDCTDLQLHRGQHGWLLNELSTRAKGHPLDERVASQVMLALYRSGRQAEALEHFQRRCEAVKLLGVWWDVLPVDLRGGTHLMGAVSSSLYKGHRYPVEIISHCVWLYHRFPLSFREAEEMMMARGVLVTYETIRGWCHKFGQTYAPERAAPPTATTRG